MTPPEDTHPRKRRSGSGWPASASALFVSIVVAACGQNAALYDPSPELLSTHAPDSFLVAVETSEGTFSVKMHRAWAPLGVDRVYHLMVNDFYAGARIYRIVDGFVAQWGFSGKPVLDSIWRDHPLPDEETVASNLRGVVTFARGGPETRNFTLFVNLVDNTRLDSQANRGIEGYPPVGVIEAGLGVIDGFYAAYTDPRPSQDSIRFQGNAYLRREFPQLDSIISTWIVESWR